MYPCQKAVLDEMKTEYNPIHGTIEYTVYCCIVDSKCGTGLPNDIENYHQILASNECLRILCWNCKWRS